jgi:hypothetical protein
MKDANPYNVLFKHTQPVFIDFGSFCKIKDSKQYWSALDEFRKSFFYPLSIYSWGAEFTSRKIIHSYYTSISDSEYLLLKYRFLRIVNKKYLDKLCRYYFGSKRLAHVSEEKFARFSGFKYAILKFLRKICMLFPTKFNYEREVRKILKLKPSFSTEWGAYHQIHFYNDDGNITLSERMKAVVDIIKKYRPEKIMELAGNQGVLSREIANMDFVHSVLCTDYDEHAIDVLYQHEKSQNSKISPVLINFMQPLVSDVTEHPYKRFRSDMVIALAVTHHLILRQKYNLDHVLDLISQYTNKYLLIEFMPLGLFDGKYAPPVPEWYTLTWFRECILKKFEILSEHNYEENRHLIVAKK